MQKEKLPVLALFFAFRGKRITMSKRQRQITVLKLPVSFTSISLRHYCSLSSLLPCFVAGLLLSGTLHRVL